MAVTMNAAAATMTSSAVLSSSASVSFNGGMRVNMAVAPRRSALPLAIRAYGPPAGEPGTGKDERNIGDKMKDAAIDISNKIQDKMPAGTQPGGVGRKPGDEWTQYSSTGELNEDKKKAAERNNPDGLNIMDKLTDAGRTLKSKTNDVVTYGAHRNADTVEDNVTEKNIREQSEYTKNL